MRLLSLELLFDNADVTAAFHAGESNFRKVIEMSIEAHILLQVMHGDVVAPHHGKVTFAVAHDGVGCPFDQNSKPM